LARNLYYENIINLAGNNSKNVWNLIKDAAGIKKNNKIIPLSDLPRVDTLTYTVYVIRNHNSL